MSLYIPLIKKMYYSSPVYMERSLPKNGEISVVEGQKVDPVTKIGLTKVSYGVMNIDKNLKVVSGKTEDGYFYKGEKIGRVGLNYVLAPFNGYLDKTNDSFNFYQEDRDYRLMAGLWGTVTGVVKDRSTLIKTQTIDIPFAYSSGSNTSGELVVFPNPSELLELQYLEHYTRGAEDKIIYVGGYASEVFLQEAVRRGVSAVIAGGADKKSFTFAKQNGLFLGGFNGFGNIPVAAFVYDFLKQISSRFVFIDGLRNMLRIPVSEDYKFPNTGDTHNYDNIRKLDVGLKVQIFIKPYFGWFGEVVQVQGRDIYVKLYLAEEPVIVSIPNILAVE